MLKPAGQDISYRSQGVLVWVETRFLDGPSRNSEDDGFCRVVEVPAGFTVGELISLLRLPVAGIHQAQHNGCDIPGWGTDGEQIVIEDGDLLAFSGRAVSRAN